MNSVRILKLNWTIDFSVSNLRSLTGSLTIGLYDSQFVVRYFFAYIFNLFLVFSMSSALEGLIKLSGGNIMWARITKAEPKANFLFSFAGHARVLFYCLKAAWNNIFVFCFFFTLTEFNKDKISVLITLKNLQTAKSQRQKVFTTRLFGQTFLNVGTRANNTWHGTPNFAM